MTQEEKSTRRLARRVNWETILAALLVIAISFIMALVLLFRPEGLFGVMEVRRI